MSPARTVLQREIDALHAKAVKLRDAGDLAAATGVALRLAVTRDALAMVTEAELAAYEAAA